MPTKGLSDGGTRPKEGAMVCQKRTARRRMGTAVSLNRSLCVLQRRDLIPEESERQLHDFWEKERAWREEARNPYSHLNMI